MASFPLKKILLFAVQAFTVIIVLLLVLGIGLFLRTSGDYAVAKTVAQDSTLPHITLDGVTFHAETFGDSTNPAVLVLHGGPGNDYRYLLPLSDLADSFFVIFYDQRGSGLSPRVSKEHHTLDTSLADVKRFVDHFSPDTPIHIIGHSWGAMLASGFTAQYPQRVSRLVLAEPGVLTSEMGRVYKERFKIKPSWPLFKGILKAYFESLHIKQIDGQERKDYFLQRVALMDIKGNPLKEYYCNGDPTTAFMPFWRYSLDANITIQKSGIKDGAFAVDLVSGIEEYKDTVLFITSSCNNLIGTEYQKGHMKHFPLLRHVEIENAGHTMIGERPEECSRLIRDYLKGAIPHSSKSRN